MPNFQLVNKPSGISQHEVLQSGLIKTDYHWLMNNNVNDNNNNNMEEEGGGGVLAFLTGNGRAY